MAINPTIVQNLNGQTGIAGATGVSVAPAATAKGNLLIGIVGIGASAAGVTISTPPAAGWLLQRIVTANNGTQWLTLAIYVYPNNPGGITTFAIGTTGSQSLAVIFYEINGISVAGLVGKSENTNTSSTPAASGAQPQAATCELDVEILLNVQSAVTDTSVAPFPNLAKNINNSSTVATPNITLSAWPNIAPNLSGAVPRFTATLGASVFWLASIYQLGTDMAAGGQLVNNGAKPGLLASGAGYCGALGI